MNELIDKDSTFKKILSECESADNKDEKVAYLRAASIILTMPSVNADTSQQITRQGKWILMESEVKSDEVTHETYKCSACLGVINYVRCHTGDISLPLFCEHCGASMTGLAYYCSYDSGGDS